MTVEPSAPRFRMQLGPGYLRAVWAMIVIGILEVLVGVGQLLVRATDTQADDGALIILSGMFLSCGIAQTGAGVLIRHSFLTAEVRLTARGLINRDVRPRCHLWHTIADVRAISRGRYLRTMVVFTDGRRKILVAPLARSSVPDPAFIRDVQPIREWWLHHRTAR
ncbi:hypothetical protein [Nocardia brasiliensis]|uniref:hypothetical protein n=1 Tax=Nocardia brasiliensis TaxID=37326 RepID=UPI002456CA31|nr:hypothetical protein [Nocardia brasiliensis]